MIRRIAAFVIGFTLMWGINGDIRGDEMTKLTRRSLFPMAAVGVVAAADGSQGASITQNGMTVQLRRYPGGWEVLTPDFEYMHGYWRPGMSIPLKWVPLREYLDLIDKTYAMDA